MCVTNGEVWTREDVSRPRQGARKGCATGFGGKRTAVVPVDVSMESVRETSPELGAPVVLHDEGHNLSVVGHGLIIKPKHSCFVATESVISEAGLRALMTVLGDDERCCADIPERILIAKGSDEDFDEYLFEADDVSLEIGSDHAHARFDLVLSAKRLDLQTYRTSLETAIARHQCCIARLKMVDASGEEVGTFPDWVASPADREKWLKDAEESPAVLEVAIEATRPMKAAQLLSAGRDGLALLNSIKREALNLESALGLLRAGQPHLLIGLPESDWFEVKSQPYGLKAPDSKVAEAAKIELAQDVARFANSPCAALLVVGLATNKQDGTERVSRVSPTKLVVLDVQQYRDVLDHRIYPPIEGLEIFQVDLGNGRGLLVVHVPAQPEEYRPFLVHGTVAAGQIEGAFISIVRRRGEGSIPTTAAQIHSTLAAGRAFLRGSSSETPDG